MPVRCGISGSCRSRTTSAQARPPVHRRDWCRPIRPGQIRRAASATAEDRLRGKGVRVDHIGSTAVPGLDAKDTIDIQVTVESLSAADEFAEALLCGIPTHARSPRTSASRPRSTVGRYDHRDDRACGGSGFTGRPIPVGRRISICASTAGQISSSRCCSSTGWWPIPMCGKSIWPSNAKRNKSAASGGDIERYARRRRSRGFSTPTAGRGHGPTYQAGSLPVSR